jgi:hypothetical protein
MKTIKYTVSTILLVVFCSFILQAQSNKSSLGLITKVVNKVEKRTGGKEWEKATKSDPLFPNDGVRTHAKSVAIIKLIDKSFLRLLENSELTMSGERRQSKNDMKLNQGTIGFDIKKQQNDKFTFTSPTAVASIRGTKGRNSVLSDFDIFTLTEGLANYRNLKSKKEVNVGAGETGISYPDGDIEVRKATDDEINAVGDALKAGDTQKQNELKFELKDQNGNKKDLKIKYKE